MNPAKLTPEDYVDTTERKTHGLVLIRSAASRGLRADIATLLPQAMESKRFPRGFLYYHSKPNQPPLAGSVRFRLTPTADPSTFASGHDLLNIHGVPWCIPLLSIASNAAFKALGHILMHDGLVSEELMQLAVQNRRRLIVNGSDCRLTSTVQSFHQPFPMKLHQYKISLVIIGKDSVVENRSLGMKNVRPFAGA